MQPEDPEQQLAPLSIYQDTGAKLLTVVTNAPLKEVSGLGAPGHSELGAPMNEHLLYARP